MRIGRVHSKNDIVVLTKSFVQRLCKLYSYTLRLYDSWLCCGSKIRKSKWEGSVDKGTGVQLDHITKVFVK